MPTYEYVCEKCGLEFEKVQSMNDQALTRCPQEICGEKKWGKGKVKKLIGAGAGLIFKGSGFYITDYRSDKYKEAAKKDSTAATPAPAAATGTESKAAPPAAGTAKAAKPEAKPAAPAKPAKPKD